MASMATSRLTQELALLPEKLPSDMTAHQTGDDALEWTATIQGPCDTPYAGGRYTLSIRFPPEYPMKPPTFRFETKIYHPNISTIDGTVFMNILYYDWSPVLQVVSLLISIQSMLGEPYADDAVELEIAHRFKTDREGFERTAGEWREMYAMSSCDEDKECKAENASDFG